RFLKAQLVFNQDEQQQSAPTSEPLRPPQPTKRYNALGILEEFTPDAVANADDGTQPSPMPDESTRPMMKSSPTIVGAGNIKRLEPTSNTLPVGWENTPRNNACPCGSGKKFKKCHGATL
ncbi:MAG: SEC-C domain-containing protein, partial [Gemmatimonadaceae bacterium]